MKRSNLNTILIIGFIALAIIIVIVIAIIVKNKNNDSSSANEPSMNSYVDPATGETIVSPTGKLPEKYGTNPDAPLIIGLDKLIARGVGDSQTDLIKAALNDYADQVKTKEKITEISLFVDSIKHTIDSTTGNDSYDFNLLFNRKKTYSAHLVTPTVSSIVFTLVDTTTGTQVLNVTKSS